MLEFIKPSAQYIDDYLSACRESFDHHITEWMPVEPDYFAAWKKQAMQRYSMLENGEGLPAHIPKMVTYWCIANNQFIGEVQIRPCLTAEEANGHKENLYTLR